MSTFGFNNINNNNSIYYNPSYYSPGRHCDGKPILYKNDGVMFGRVSRQDAQRFMSNEQESSGLTTWDKIMMIGMPLLSVTGTFLAAIFGGDDKS